MVKLILTKKEREQLAEQVREAGYKDQTEYLRKKVFASGDTPVHNPKKLFRALDKTGGELNRIGNNINQVAKYIHYLEKNNMVEARVISEYNRYFQEFLQVEVEYVKAIRAYLRTMR
ncbi:plasmid mobilization protein [Pontibacter rugosus]|uniref:Plasmid mobilization relaxosome protein MobC n=1 Tax=Pontibacter rugosus TaxID=1745966 RepID=A0ABW3SSF0_9BACT